ncbi:hypothetical protein ACUOFC_05880, partial [Escherichia sp. TWPC-MK]
MYRKRTRRRCRLSKGIQVKASLWEFIDEDRSVQTRLGREDSEYLARSVPFYAANQPLADISEMRVVQGMDEILAVFTAQTCLDAAVLVNKLPQAF